MSDSPDYDSGTSARPGDVTDRNAGESDDKPDVPSDCDTSTWLSDATGRNIGESDDGSDIPSDVSDERISSCLKYSTHNTAFIFQGYDVHVKVGTQICSDDLGNWYDKFDIHNKNMTNHFLLTGIEDGNFTTDYLTWSSWNKDDILGLYAATLFICGVFDYDLIARALVVHRVKVLIMLGKFFFDISEVNKKWLAGEIDCGNVDISRKFDSLSISDSSSKPGYYINLYDIDELVTSTKFYTDKLDNIQQTWCRGFRYRQSQRDWNNTTVKTYRLQEMDTYKVLKDFFETEVVYSDGEIPDWEKHIKIVQQTHVQQDTWKKCCEQAEQMLEQWMNNNNTVTGETHCQMIDIDYNYGKDTSNYTISKSQQVETPAPDRTPQMSNSSWMTGGLSVNITEEDQGLDKASLDIDAEIQEANETKQRPRYIPPLLFSPTSGRFIF